MKTMTAPKVKVYGTFLGITLGFPSTQVDGIQAGHPRPTGPIKTTK